MQHTYTTKINRQHEVHVQCANKSSNNDNATKHDEIKTQYDIILLITLVLIGQSSVDALR